MAGINEGQDDIQSFIFEGHNVYLLNDLIAFDRQFFVGCIREPRKIIRKKNIPIDQYWFAIYTKRTDTWSLTFPENRKAKILISEDWVRNNLPKFYEDVYKRLSSDVDRLLRKNSELERRVDHLQELLKIKDETIKDLNRGYERLSGDVFRYHNRELEYKQREEGYRNEIECRRQRSGARNRKMTQMMEQLSLSQQAHRETQQEHKRCQDVLCQIALLTPAQRQELAELFAETRAKLDPFLSK